MPPIHTDHIEPPLIPAAIDINGMRLDALDRDGVESFICRALSEERGGWVVTLNLDIMRKCRNDPGLESLVSGATLIVPDGMPIYWASRIAGTPLPERVAGSDLIWTLSERAATLGRSVYLLGGSPSSAPLAARNLSCQNHQLEIAGWSCPPFGFERDAVSMSLVKEQVLDASPDIVYVGLGFPKQEHLIIELRPFLPHTWFVGVGISIDFVAGAMPRAPSWMQQIGMEWLYRLAQEPRRLAARYLIHGPAAAANLLRWSLMSRRSPRG